MKLNDIIVKAQSESFNISDELALIEKTRLAKPDGCDIKIKPYLITRVEKYCDKYSIPFCVVCESCCSTALTYSQLYQHEKAR